MTEHYVTLFDSAFLPQGLALHHSLLEHGGDCVLWVLCLDSACLQTLQRLDLPQMRLLDLSEKETPGLLAVKQSRTRAEYCWTLTPWSIQWVLESEPTARRVTYLDADIFLLANPDPIYAEFDASGSGVLITEHGYAPEYDQTPTYGRYCVQFLSVVRGLGEPILYWWRDRCLEWCYAKYDAGRFGDQKYLEGFFGVSPGGICVISSDGRCQGPWNASYYPFSSAVLFHFHGLRSVSPSMMLLSSVYYIPRPHLKYVYVPYCNLLRNLVLSCGLVGISQASKPFALSILFFQLLKLMRWFATGRVLPPYWRIECNGKVYLL